MWNTPHSNDSLRCYLNQATAPPPTRVAAGGRDEAGRCHVPRVLAIGTQLHLTVRRTTVTDVNGRSGTVNAKVAETVSPGQIRTASVAGDGNCGDEVDEVHGRYKTDACSWEVADARVPERRTPFGQGHGQGRDRCLHITGDTRCTWPIFQSNRVSDTLLISCVRYDTCLGAI